MIQDLMRRSRSLFLLPLLFACTAAPAPLVGERTWSFDDVSVGGLPAGFVVDATRRVGPLATWEVVAGQGQGASQVLSLSYPNHKSYDSFNLCWLPALGFQDGLLKVRLCARSGKEDQGGGLFWRARGPGDYYVARLNPLEGNLRLYHVVGGNRTMLASADCKAEVGAWHELSISHIGTSITCALDGDVKIQLRDDTLAGPGGVGLWTKADAATDFDDLQVTAAR
jgi:hypothetical protein